MLSCFCGNLCRKTPKRGTKSHGLRSNCPENFQNKWGQRSHCNESFRRWRQLDPAACTWQSKNIELYQEATAQGLKNKNQPFCATGTQQKHRYCFSYKNNEFCKAKGCPRPHVCQIYAARHHKRQCPKFRQNNKPPSQTTKQSPTYSSDALVPIRKL